MTTLTPFEELQVENERLGAKISELANLLDSLLGTPCEQIRHKDEIDGLRQVVVNLRCDSDAMAQSEEVPMGGEVFAIAIKALLESAATIANFHPAPPMATPQAGLDE